MWSRAGQTRNGTTRLSFVSHLSLLFLLLYLPRRRHWWNINGHCLAIKVNSKFRSSNEGHFRVKWTHQSGNQRGALADPKPINSEIEFILNFAWGSTHCPGLLCCCGLEISGWNKMKVYFRRVCKKGKHESGETEALSLEICHVLRFFPFLSSLVLLMSSFCYCLQPNNASSRLVVNKDVQMDGWMDVRREKQKNKLRAIGWVALIDKRTLQRDLMLNLRNSSVLEPSPADMRRLWCRCLRRWWFCHSLRRELIQFRDYHPHQASAPNLLQLILRLNWSERRFLHTNYILSPCVISFYIGIGIRRGRSDRFLLFVV